MKRSIKPVIFMIFIACMLLSTKVTALTAQDYENMGLLPYKAKPYFKLGELDKLGRPTWGQGQLSIYTEAKAAETYPAESSLQDCDLPGYQVNNDRYLIPTELDQGYIQRVWSQRYLLQHGDFKFRDVMNFIRNHALITNYTDNGFPLDKRTGLFSISQYEKALVEWMKQKNSDKKFSKNKSYMVDYKIELIYQGEELVPRQVKLRYVGLTPKGELEKIDLEGKEDFDANGIATVTLDNIAPHVTIDYLTGEVTAGEVFVSVNTETEDDVEIVYVDDKSSHYYFDDNKEFEENGNKYLAMPEPEAIDKGYEYFYDDDVYVDTETGYYYYYEVKSGTDIDDYVYMTERAAIVDGYVWDAAEGTDY
ncbi:hypothetical protein [Streptococcus sp. sy018]|uniref:hypothetical protein n=1 Tax=Streptococcus sp. sy018 TaxID=2600147 RepID=UPI0011B69387|nr:hypothetical protein [Streptococcus sp. sy018]TWS95467.1 hypothetical protein FRX52_01325 [Streptococcus sp. sy018]